MSGFDIVGLIVALIAAALIGALIVVLTNVVRTLIALQSTVDALRTETTPMLIDLRTMIAQTDAELARVDGVIGLAEASSTQVQVASRIATRAFANPLIKTASVGSGAISAVRWLAPRRNRAQRAQRALNKGRS